MTTRRLKFVSVSSNSDTELDRCWCRRRRRRRCCCWVLCSRTVRSFQISVRSQTDHNSVGNRKFSALSKYINTRL